RQLNAHTAGLRITDAVEMCRHAGLAVASFGPGNAKRRHRLVSHDPRRYRREEAFPQKRAEAAHLEHLNAAGGPVVQEAIPEQTARRLLHRERSSELVAPSDECGEFELEIQPWLRPELHIPGRVAGGAELAPGTDDRRPARANGGGPAVIADRKLEEDAGRLAIAHVGHVRIGAREVRETADPRGQCHLCQLVWDQKLRCSATQTVRTRSAGAKAF